MILENNQSKRGDFVRVILISFVYCLVQIPNMVPASLQLSVTTFSFNNSNDEINTSSILYHDTYLPVFIYLFSVAASSVGATLVTLTRYHDAVLLMFLVMSVCSRVLIERCQSYSLLNVLGAVAGAGSGGSFVTTTLYLILLSDTRKTCRNFSFFAACCGTSYFLYAGVLGITTPCSVGPCRGSTLVVSTAGLLVMVLFVLRNRSSRSKVTEKSVLFSKESLDYVNGTLRYRQHLSSWFVCLFENRFDRRYP
ncbi:hypothetical protein ACHWQZ_G009174 [Mnemiopsis leidyi]